MIPDSVLLLLAKATIVLLLALGVTRLMHRASAGARHLVWLVSLSSLLLVPGLTAWAPVRIAVLPAATPEAPPLPTAEHPRTSVAAEETDAEASVVSSSVEQGPIAATPSLLARVRSANPIALLVALWALVSFAILLSILHAWLAVRRIVRRSEPLASREWLDPLYEVADRLGLDDAPRLVRSADAKMPFACGIATPTIVLPADCDSWTVERRRAVLLHELAHVRRHDLAGHTLGRLVCAVYWFHPLVWTAAQRLRSESERACDDLALICGARAADYAEHLLDIVTSVRRDRTPLVALAMARPSEFEGRMLAILDPERPRRTASRIRTASLIGGLAVISLVVGAAAPTPRNGLAPLAQQAGVGGAQPDIQGAPSADRSYDATRQDEKLRQKALDKARVRGMSEVAAGQATAEADASVSVGAIAGAAIDDALESIARPTIKTVISSLLQGESAELHGRAKSERAELLAKVLRADTSAALRRVAAWGLHEFTDEAVASEALAHALRRDASVRVREMAAWALGAGETNHQAGHDALAAALRGDAEAEVRQTAAWALGQIEKSSAIEPLVAALADRDVGVRFRAAWAIGSIEPREAPRQLVALLSDRDPKMREIVAWALYNIEDASAVPALQSALRTEQDKDLQVAYIRALASMGDKSVDALRTLLESSDQRVRTMAVRALAGGDATGPWPWPWPEPRPYP